MHRYLYSYLYVYVRTVTLFVVYGKRALKYSVAQVARHLSPSSLLLSSSVRCGTCGRTNGLPWISQHFLPYCIILAQFCFRTRDPSMRVVTTNHNFL